MTGISATGMQGMQYGGMSQSGGMKTGGPQGGPPPGGGMRGKIQEVDTNEDQLIQEDEFDSLISSVNSETGVELDAEALFAELDADENGSIDKDEMEGLKDKLPEPPMRPNVSMDQLNFGSKTETSNTSMSSQMQTQMQTQMIAQYASSMSSSQNLTSSLLDLQS